MSWTLKRRCHRAAGGWSTHCLYPVGSRCRRCSRACSRSGDFPGRREIVHLGWPLPFAEAASSRHALPPRRHSAAATHTILVTNKHAFWPYIALHIKAKVTNTFSIIFSNYGNRYVDVEEGGGVPQRSKIRPYWCPRSPALIRSDLLEAARHIGSPTGAGVKHDCNQLNLVNLCSPGWVGPRK